MLHPYPIPFGSSDILCQHSFVDLIIINAMHTKLLGGDEI